MSAKQVGSIFKRSCSWFLVNLLIATFGAPVASYAVEQNSTIIGRSSFVRDCYDRSRQAALYQSANRTDIDVCNRAIADGAVLKKELAASYSNRGVLHMAMQNYSQAYKDYERALNIDDKLAEAYINRGNLWFTVEQFDRAISDYDRAIEYGTDKAPIALLNRGLAFEYKGDFSSAESNYRASLEMNPDFEQAQEKLDRLTLKRKTKANE